MSASTLVTILAAFAIRDGGLWAWKRFAQKRRTARNTASAMRFFRDHLERQRSS